MLATVIARYPNTPKMATVNFKKRSRPSNQRQRDKAEEENDGDEVEEAVQIIKPQLRTIAPIVQSTKKFDEEGHGSTSTVYASTREIVPKTYAGDATYISSVDTSTDRLVLLHLPFNTSVEMLEQF
jgi:hypothetical protein